MNMVKGEFFMGRAGKKSIDIWYQSQMRRLKEELAITNSGVTREEKCMLRVIITPEEKSLVNSLGGNKINGRFN